MPKPSTWPATAGGCWIQPGVDTWAELRLIQRGSAVEGALAFCGPFSGCSPGYRLSGSVAFPSVVLNWTTEQNGQTYHSSFNGLMSANGDTLSGIASTQGQPGQNQVTYHRVATQ